MKKLILTIATLLNITALRSQSFQYPAARKTDQVDVYFGTSIADPYRWLEDDRSDETAKWVNEENKITEDYLSKIPFRNTIKARLKELWNFPKSSAPFKAGDNYFVYTNNGLQNQFVLNIIRGSIDKKPEVFLDPNKMSDDGTINIAMISASSDGKYLAYAISRGGSDWQEIYVKSTENGTVLNDKIEWVKFSGIAWKGNGFYYSRFDAPDSSDLLKGKNEFHKIYYHKIGNPQKYDRLVFEDKKNPSRTFSAEVSDDENYLIISGSEGTSGNNLTILDLKNENATPLELIKDFSKDNAVVDNDSTIFYIHTNNEAPRYKLVSIDIADLSKGYKSVITEDEENVLQSVNIGNNIFIARYMKDATSLLKLYTKEGIYSGQVPLDGIGSVDQMNSKKKDTDLFYGINSFTAPAVIYKFNLKDKSQTEYFRPKMNFNYEDYVTEQVFYKSKDGTKVPMFIFHKKGIALNGNNPTLIFGYGGFNIPMVPQFKLERLIFLENGGIVAIPNLRGGGEYGENWHKAGTKLEKQNVFNDCIAAAEYLIKNKYTNPEKLAINGRSNGGLLAAAVMLQRPDLFKVALPTVGVLDMLRYHKFTIGWAWKGDYGSSEDEIQFRNLLKYSPLHNIKENVKYPATLVSTGDHDDRVVPAHSFKFITTLQEKYKGPNPALIRIDINSGHASTTALGSSKPVAKQIDEMTDIFSFLMYNLGMNADKSKK